MSLKSFIGVRERLPQHPDPKNVHEVQIVKDAYDQSLIPQHFLAQGVSLEKMTEGLSYKQLVAKFIKNLFYNVQNGRSILFQGPMGYGKTFAAIAIQRAALHHGASTRYAKEREAIAALVSPNQTDLSDTIKTCDVLVLDELGTTSGGALVYIEDLLRTRMERCLTTLVTTNLNNEGINASYPRFWSAQIETYELITCNNSTSINFRTMRAGPRK